MNLSMLKLLALKYYAYFLHCDVELSEFQGISLKLQPQSRPIITKSDLITTLRKMAIIVADGSSSCSNGAHEKVKMGLTSLGCNVQTQFVACTDLPTQKFGMWKMYAFRSIGCFQKPQEPVAMVFGEVSSMREKDQHVLVRVHDQCITSEVFGSLRCDCKLQLENAQQMIQQHGCGIIVYLPQEGRGIGLANKIHAYSEQDDGADTVQANRYLGFADDYRTYECVEYILKSHFQLNSIRLITNNPRKVELLSELGIRIEERIPSIVPVGKFSKKYIDTKINKMQHMLESTDSDKNSEFYLPHQEDK